MNILLVEPYFTGSHAAWAAGLQQYSSHHIEIIKMSGHYWKWRMHGGAITLAQQFMELDFQPDLILATDMLDLNIFLSLTREKSAGIPTAIYFHENQLTYPWSPTDRDVENNRDNHYSFINYASALAADKLFFNSKYHLESFMEELPNFLKGFPDNNELETVEQIREKSEVLYLGMDLQKFDAARPEEIESYPRAVLLWNHRWEYDKNPEDFFNALYELQEHGVDFRLIVLGENFSQQPEVFEEAREKLAEKIIHFGYVETFEEYAKWLWTADILPVTSNQDFFGGSVIEAMYCNVKPLLPKRLAYPEHIPEQFHRTFYYDDNKDFVRKLQRRIFDVKVLKNQNTAKWVSQYDWQHCIAGYDRHFSAIKS